MHHSLMTLIAMAMILPCELAFANLSQMYGSYSRSENSASSGTTANTSNSPSYYTYTSSTTRSMPAKKRQAAPQRKIGWEPIYAHPQTIDSSGRKTFIVDPKWLTWGAYDENGNLIRTGRASMGKGYCPDTRSRCYTPSGSFQVYRKGNASCKSSKFPVGKGGAPMPYCMFFKGGYAVHGSPDVPNYNASHGCIRVTPTDAQWLHQNFMSVGTKVIVKPYSAPKAKPTTTKADFTQNESSM